MPEVFDNLTRIYKKVEADSHGPQHWTFWLNEKDYEELRGERCGVMPQKVWNAQIRLATKKVEPGTVVVESQHPEQKKADLVGIFRLVEKPKEEVRVERDGECADVS